jgi:hypothetical protein
MHNNSAGCVRLDPSRDTRPAQEDPSEPSAKPSSRLIGSLAVQEALPPRSAMSEVASQRRSPAPNRYQKFKSGARPGL